MSTAVMTNRLELTSAADTALKAATRFWFGVTVIGQLIFASTVAIFYGAAAARGNLHAWNRGMTHGYIAGDRIGNVAVAIHLISAVIIILSGAIQIVPQVRNRFPAFHRWNGRIYMVTAFTISLAGLYMMWVRGTVGGLVPHVAQSLDAVLIMVCAVMALRYALARDFKTHRRWALRLYLVVSASLFIRAGLVFGGLGFDQDKFFIFMSFAQYLVPLAVLEIYLRTQERPGAARRFAMAGGLLVLTLALGVGIVAATGGIWLPNIRRAFDHRKSIGDALAVTIASNGVDPAFQQYRDLKAASPAIYNFDEDQLNTLGYELLRNKQFKDAIRVFQLNIEAYPQSSNVYDSLGEGYMDDGDKPLAVANYEKSLQLNPKNGNGIAMLRKLGAR
jgi:uncharacterized membrane protein